MDGRRTVQIIDGHFAEFSFERVLFHWSGLEHNKMLVCVVNPVDSREPSSLYYEVLKDGQSVMRTGNFRWAVKTYNELESCGEPLSS